MINYKLKTEAVPFGQLFQGFAAYSFLLFHLSFIIYNYCRLSKEPNAKVIIMEVVVESKCWEMGQQF